MMTASRINISTAALILACAILGMTAVHTAQDPDLPSAVTQKANRIQTAIETRLRVGEIVAGEDARPHIAKIIKRYRRAAGSWQLDAVASELTDQQAVDFVIARAQHILTCTVSLWNRVSLEKDIDTQPDAIEKMLAEMTPSGNTGNFRIGNDCATLVDLSGTPVEIRGVTEVSQVLDFERAFEKSVTSRVLKTDMTQSATYRANAAYFTRQFAASLTEDLGFAQALQRSDAGVADARIFRFSMANLMFYLSYDKQGRTQLVFIAPFSW